MSEPTLFFGGAEFFLLPSMEPIAPDRVTIVLSAETGEVVKYLVDDPQETAS